MQFHYKIVVRWEGGSYETPSGVCCLINAVSIKHANNKVLKRATQMPCFRDRESEGVRVEAEVYILNESDHPCHRGDSCGPPVLLRVR